MEDLTVGPSCQRASGNGERAACGKGAADARGPGVSEGSGRARDAALAMQKGVLGRTV